MEIYFLFKAFGYLIIGLLSVTLLIVSLAAATKEHRSKDQLKGLVFFTLSVIGLCTFVALFVGYIQAGAGK